MNKRAITHWLQSAWKPNGFQAMPELRAILGTEIGLVRKENQDRAFVVRFNYAHPRRQCFTLALLCDGMGGMVAGGQCAESAATEIICAMASDSPFDIEQRAVLALEAANRKVYQHYNGRGGTTVAALILTEDSVLGLTAGDSRIYSYDGKSFFQISTDDTIAGALSKIPGYKPANDVLDSTSRHIAQYIGMGEGLQPRVYRILPTHQRLSFLLTSDGAHSIGNENIEKLFGNSHNGEFLRRLFALSKWFGGHDNSTAIQIDTDGTFTKPQFRCEWESVKIWGPDGAVEFVSDDPTESKAHRDHALLHEGSGASIGTKYTDPKSASPIQAPLPPKKDKRSKAPHKKADQQRLEIEVRQPTDSALKRDETDSSGNERSETSENETT